ncbi:MAG: hypothetical protein ACLS9K_09415 [Lachnospira eligens]
MNLKTQEISEVFKLDNKSTRNYTKLAGYDGQYFYVFDKPDLSKGIKNITTDDKNIVYILDTNGEIKDTLEFNQESTKTTADVNILGGDRRYLLVTTTDTDIQQFKASSELMSKYEELKKRMETEGSSKLAQVCLSAVLDKADIGTETRSGYRLLRNRSKMELLRVLRKSVVFIAIFLGIIIWLSIFKINNTNDKKVYAYYNQLMYEYDNQTEMIESLTYSKYVHDKTDDYEADREYIEEAIKLLQGKISICLFF